MSIIRCYMSFRDGLHTARAVHVHYVCMKLGASDANFGTLKQLNECYSLVHDFRSFGALCTCTCTLRVL